MEEKLLKKRVKEDKVYALVHIISNIEPYVIRIYERGKLISSSKFKSEGQSKERLDRLTE